MSELLKGNAVIGQSGGPTAVINQSLVGVIEGLKGHPGVEKIYGAHHAVAGIVKGDFIELQDCAQDFLDKIANSPSSALGSSRDKPDAAYCKRIFESFEKHNVRYFFYAGGNDSSDTCRIVNELAKEEGYELRCFHVPKTVDNDLVLNDHTPGFGSAAKFVAQAFMGDNLDNRALPGIKINIIMGRHAGFLTAASILGRRAGTDDGPHLVYVPEAPFDENKFIDDVEAAYKKFGRCLIAVSEGISDKDGTAIAAKLQENVETDAHGNVQLSGSGALGDLLSDLIKDKLGKRTGEKLRVRADTFGYLQRSFVGCVSEVDQAEARQAGRRAAELALSGDLDGSIAIQRVSDDPYKVEFNRIELSDVAAKTQHLDTKYIVDGCNIDDSFKVYLAPIVGELPEIATFDFATAEAK
ncbi:6-phosphofructokinase [Poriferisphaera sp. WC338]|uniref:6-phosphofructokinase n=1 Tax=Poriferisphaera sp. WC338 TaxID=3425129 RepID=UPI003D814202